MKSERILVVARAALERCLLCGPIQDGAEQEVLARSGEPGPKPFIDVDAAWEALKTISTCYKFAGRNEAEDDPSLKQIIPYVVIRAGSKIMLMRRLRKQSEKRLWDKYSIGIGGHLNTADGKSDFFDYLLTGLERELQEELHISTGCPCRLIGCINDDTNDVGRVHFGIAFQALVSADDVQIREVEKMTGRFVEISELDNYKPEMESWSRILCEHFFSDAT
ncbi:hypothetical protein J7M28_12985 [bacterium]|nr:hypothetical protein [bacterium]